jgi:hypothetical protein
LSLGLGARARVIANLRSRAARHRALWSRQEPARIPQTVFYEPASGQRMASEISSQPDCR